MFTIQLSFRKRPEVIITVKDDEGHGNSQCGKNILIDYKVPAVWVIPKCAM